MTAPSDVRWQALFQQSGDALFLLNRRRRLLFANRAWEALAGMPLAEAHGLVCRRSRAAAPTDTLRDVLTHVLAPPSEVLGGRSVRARRLLPSRAGACWWDVDFFPIRNDGALLAVLGRIVPVAQVEPAATAPPLPEKLAALRERVVRGYDDLFEGAEPALGRVAAGVRVAAQVTAPVLLVGEPGTGRRTLARLIHYRGAARERAFAALDATRVPSAALAAVLFGDNLATVYIQEPGRLPRDIQSRLVDVLEEDDAERPGPRILAGCCSDPAADVRAGRLLPQLHAALAVLTVPLPPLRERLDEYPRLVDAMLARAGEDHGRPRSSLTPEAWAVVRAYSWPGNLRELFAVLSAARARAQGDRITAADLPASLRLSARLAQAPDRSPDKPLPLEALLAETERRLIRLALKRAGGHRGRAAEMLGVWRQRLVRRMEGLGMGETASDEGSG